MHLDGMKQEEVEKSNLLGTVVAVCPAFLPKSMSGNKRKSHFTLWIFRFFLKKPCSADHVNECNVFTDSRKVRGGLSGENEGFYLENVSSGSYSKHFSKMVP